MKRQLLCVALALGLASPALQAAEGMWLLDELPRDALKSAHDFEPTPQWLERLQGASLRLSGGCSAAFVSADGLVLTNHHCISRCLAQLSGQDHDLLHTGAIAVTRDEEAICPELELQQLQGVQDITAGLAAATRDLSAEQIPLALDAAREQMLTQCRDQNPGAHCELIELYGGSRTLVYRYRRFRDVRLVFAPETEIARFGGTIDSFSFPRYVLDVGLLRAYVDGEAFQPGHYLSPRVEGPNAEELVFVTGHPGATRRHLTVAQLETLRDVVLPQQLSYLAELRGVLGQFAREGRREREMAQRELLSVSNTLKAYRGRHAALAGPGFMALRQQRETELQRRVKDDRALRRSTAGAWDAIAQSQLVWRQIHTEYAMLELMQGLQSDLLAMARHLVRAAEELEKPDAQRLAEYTEAVLPQLTQRLFSAAPIHKRLETLTLGWSLDLLRQLLGPDHPAVQISLGDREPEQLAAEIIAATHLDDPTQRLSLWQGGREAVVASEDPLIRLIRALEPLARALRERYEREVREVEQRQLKLLSQARYALQQGPDYPQASHSLRLSYGTVSGWQEPPRVVSPFTTLAGAMARATGQPPYRLPPAWRDAEADLDLATAMNFTTTNDIVAGNSGSPVVDARGRLVGLIFDGNAHSLGGAYAYDGRYNRAIAVHPAAIKAALDGVYRAPALSRELFGDEAAP